ncbi:hypothetical protein P692DRAFT_201784660 [Suillus brevipes Sb2]|nr:hypothetical protein P692DRAFT_201784660 [Suillus brevipes Sb2]
MTSFVEGFIHYSPAFKSMLYCLEYRNLLLSHSTITEIFNKAAKNFSWRISPGSLIPT